MNQITFVYCFSKKLSVNDEQYKVNLELFSESTKLLARYFNFKIITDTYTVKDLENFTKNIEIVDTDKFFFIDDFKIKILQNLKSNEILIDPDIIVKRRPKYELTADIIFDYEDSPLEEWYLEDIEKIKNTEFYSKLKSIKNIPFIPNIGFLKINNSELLTDYINSYNYYKRELLEKVKFSFPKFSILLGQYLLGILLHEGNYSYYSFRTNNTGSIYIHLGGPQKYAKLNKNKSII